MRTVNRQLKTENIYKSILRVIHEGEFVLVLIIHHKNNPNASCHHFLALTEDDHDRAGFGAGLEDPVTGALF